MGTPDTRSSLNELGARLPDLTLRDERRLRRRLDRARGAKGAEAKREIAAQLAAEIDAAELRVSRRRSAAPAVTYPAALPVSQKKDDLLAAIRDHQVVIVAGETGSGKTTQLPKICLELGRGVRGMIGHTQPRRLAARTVAERIADELGTPLGQAVGYQVRFTDHAGDDTLVKLMTDGILLNELAHDRDLLRYDTLIIDEAHERSLNIDFILGYLKRLLPRRPDLKVIITSATIDPERFAAHYDAPIVEVSGRTYPVEVRYRPLTAEAAETDDPDDDPPSRHPTAALAVPLRGAVPPNEDRDQAQGISDAVDELSAEGPGDILVFLSGEREIRDTADALAKRELRDTEIVPLYARLSSAEQHRVFTAHRGRRVVLATNVAETSLTVPGITYVIDPGTARISRYSHRTKVQRLPIEAVSQASANQRKGRCGRTSDGVCVRLYSEDDFAARPEFTDPEILRTNLASVILQMTDLGLGDVAEFPFIDPPDRRQVKDGVALLHELGAIDPEQSDPRKRLTSLGRKLAKLPTDPRLARMILEAGRNGCAKEVMIIAAALSIQDPRERPVDKQQAAGEMHARFTEPGSDFLTLLNLWRHLRERRAELSSNQFRRLCRAEFLNFLRVREWQDVYAQLRQLAKPLGITLNSAPAEPDTIHQSLLAGLLSHIGLKDGEKQEYLGARGGRFAIFPGSGLFRKSPRWVMSGELVETSRLYARVNAKIEPEWAEKLAPHLVKRAYSEPHWEKKQGAVMAYERVTLYGVPIVASRKVNYGGVDPEESRDLFIRNALVEGDWETHHRFFAANRALLDEVEELENRARRRDILVDDESLFAFYDARVPAGVVSGRHFDSWWKKARRADPDLLNFEKSMLMNDRSSDISERDYPDVWRQGGLTLPLTYQFEPGTDADGVTVHIPVAQLNQVSPDGFEWQIPGLREELVAALIKTLPKPLRRNFVPAPDYARRVLARSAPREEPLLDAVERELRQASGIVVPRDAWQLDRLPDHLRMTFRVTDPRGRVLGESTDLEALKRKLAPKMRAAVTAAVTRTNGPGAAPVADISHEGARTWEFGAVPEVVERRDGAQTVKGYPALADEGDSVAVRVYASPDQQRHAMRAGARRLLLLTVPSPAKQLAAGLDNRSKLALSHNPDGSVAALLDDCVAAAVDHLMAAHGGPPRDEPAFAKLRDAVRQDLSTTAEQGLAYVIRVLSAVHEIERTLKDARSMTVLASLTDIRAQMSRLIKPGFVTFTGLRRLPDLLRYVQAVRRRLERLGADPNGDAERTRRMEIVQQAYAKARDGLRPARRADDDVEAIRWMIEELRVSLFAQTLGTPYPVSEKRVLKAIADLPR
ncbi:MAG TPA: ATP-dependent RNA helicase HrpA [Streptosporangiaceae bacterium]|jgi:ATP-dependent helicase HrpA